ncbi:MAG: enoyl-CoA hydratase/isomerase family protein, partial [Candidatus Eremiobacteraeota bacterium]|nr:enoyl-CoA hydratase/isomerase family protein [Candidatus Eremiobacteraeota bacterium]
MDLHAKDLDGVRVFTLDNPPINALGFTYSGIILAALDEAEKDASVKGAVFTGANNIFSGGADVNDFATEPHPGTKSIRDVIAAIERSDKIYAVAIDGNALGGGLELSLACDYRLATKRSKVGLPEIKLGLIPGAGGTQRLPRLVGAQAGLEFMLKGNSYSADQAKELGIIDEVVEENVVSAAVNRVKNGAKRRVSEMKATIGKGITAQAAPFVVSQAHKMVPTEENGGFAAHKLIDAVEAAVELPFAFGIAREARLFEELVRSKPSFALRHIFFAERELAKIPGLPPAQPAEVKKAGVVGAGTMGSGIAITFAQAGIPVAIIDSNDEAVDKARQTIMGMFMYQ